MAEHNETIRDDDLREALGANPWDLEGKTITRVCEVEDSEVQAFLLVCSDGSSYLIDTDIGYSDDGIHRDPDKHEIYVADATETDAGRQFS